MTLDAGGGEDKGESSDEDDEDQDEFVYDIQVSRGAGTCDFRVGRFTFVWEHVAVPYASTLHMCLIFEELCPHQHMQVYLKVLGSCCIGLVTRLCDGILYAAERGGACNGRRRLVLRASGYVFKRRRRQQEQRRFEHSRGRGMGSGSTRWCCRDPAYHHPACKTRRQVKRYERHL